MSADILIDEPNAMTAILTLQPLASAAILFGHVTAAVFMIIALKLVMRN